MHRKTILVLFFLTLFGVRNVFSLSDKGLFLPGHPGAVFESKKNFVFLFRRDNQGKYHLLRFDLNTPSVKPLDITLESAPSSLNVSATGEKVFWFTPFGGAFYLLDLKTKEQKVILSKKPNEKSYWMDSPYQVSFLNSDSVEFLGYAMSEDGTGGPDGIFRIDLQKEGLNAFRFLVAESDLVKAALPLQGPLSFVFPAFGESLIYGIKDESEVHLLKYDLTTRTSSRIDDFQVLAGRPLISSDKKWMAYNVFRKKNAPEIVIYSVVDGTKKVVASGPYFIMDVSSDGSVVLAARDELKKATIGLFTRDSGFKFKPFTQLTEGADFRGRFVETQKGLSILVSTAKGIKLFGP